MEEMLWCVETKLSWSYLVMNTFAKMLEKLISFQIKLIFSISFQFLQNQFPHYSPSVNIDLS